MKNSNCIAVSAHIIRKTMEQNRNILAGKVFHSLRGGWRFERNIAGHGRMNGCAEFAQMSDEDLSYAENGVHELPGGEKLGFFQKYIYRLNEGNLLAYFADLRPFHALCLYPDGGILKAAAMHLCGADQYRGEYIFHDNNNFLLKWDVKGPKKNYVIETRYKRQGLC